jgi:hypothetical protein
VFAGTAAACPSPGAPGTVLGYPACVYGLFMYVAIAYVAIAVISGAALWKARRTSHLASY